MLQKLNMFFMPVYEGENPAWFFKAARLIFAITLLAIPLAYDLQVPEVAGDPRWNLMHWSALLLATLYFAAKAQVGGKLSPKLPIAVWIAIALGLIAAVSVLWTVSIVKSWWFLKHYLAYITLFLFAFSLRNENWYRHLIWILAFTVAYNSLLGILQFLNVTDTQLNNIFPLREDILGFFHQSKSAIVRAFPIEYLTLNMEYFRMSAPPAGTLSNKNLAGSYMVLTIPLMAYLFFTAHTKIGKACATLCLILGSTFLVYTRSRGSWLAFVAAIIFMALWLVFTPKHRQILKDKLNKQNIILLLGSLAVITGASFVESPLKGFHSIDKTVTQQVESIASISAGEVGTRIAYNRNGLEIVKDNPLGIGIGAFHTIYPMYHDAGMPTPELGFSILARPQRMHNDIGQTFVELGIPGGLLYLALLMSMVFMVYHLAKRTEKHSNVELFTLFGLVSIVGISVNSLGDFPLQMPTAPGILWITMGMIAGLYATYAPERKVGCNRKEPLSIHMSIFVLLSLACAAALGFVMKDDWNRRQGAILLKPTISYARNQQFTMGVLEYINRAYNTYPYNTRTREYLGVIAVNMKDKRISTDTKINILQTMTKYDPYSPNGNINLCGLYLQKVKEAASLKDKQALKMYLDKAIEHHQMLLKIAPFSAYTHALGGLIYLYKDEVFKSVSSYKEALSIDPNFSNARAGLAQAENVIRAKGMWDEYQRMQGGATLKVPNVQ